MSCDIIIANSALIRLGRIAKKGWCVKNVSGFGYKTAIDRERCDMISPVCMYVGEKKLGRVICPDPWKSGARNTVGKLVVFCL